MSSFVTRTEQKLKEWWGSKITQDPQLETKKQKVNEVDQYMRGLSKSFQAISALFQQMHAHFANIANITQRLYEKEVDVNKRIGVEISSMFGNLSELYRSKVEPVSAINKNFTEWFATVETLKLQLEKYHEVRLVYDHFKSKVETLQKEQLANVQKGNPEFKLTEKVRRNEHKYGAAENNYKQRLSEILNNMNKILFQYYKMINTSVETFMGIEYDLDSNSKSILKKNLKTYNKFKYPEQEPIIDLIRQGQEVISSISDKASQQIEESKLAIAASLNKKQDKLQKQHSSDKSEDGEPQNRNPFDNFGQPPQQTPMRSQIQPKNIDFFDDSTIQQMNDIRQSKTRPPQQQQQSNPFDQYDDMPNIMGQQQQQSNFQPQSPFDDQILYSQINYRQSVPQFVYQPSAQIFPDFDNRPQQYQSYQPQPQHQQYRQQPSMDQLYGQPIRQQQQQQQQNSNPFGNINNNNNPFQ